VAEVFAGFIVGYALAIIIAPVGAIWLISSNKETGFAQKVAPPGTNVIALAMFLHMLAFFITTGLGMIFGLALGGIEDRRPDPGLGSPNLVYTLLVLTTVAVFVIPLMIMPWRRYALLMGLLVAVAFGWALPWLAEAA
jgi:hypothetical protein